MRDSSKTVRQFMTTHLDRANELMAIGSDPTSYEPMRILEIGGPKNLKRVTTTGLESGRDRRYYLTPDRTAIGGWKILEIEVECAVCKGQGYLEDNTPCRYCAETGWLKVRSAEERLRNPIS